MAAMRERRQRAGNCIRCGMGRSERSDQLCDRHFDEQRRRYRTKRGLWVRVVSSQRLPSKGIGWWEIVLACGHAAAVLHGLDDPLDERCVCCRCNEEPPLVDAVDPVDGVVAD
jgi:hypothetical protein